MSNVRYLNLDELVSSPVKVILGGNEYEVKEMSVEEFIKLLKLQQEASIADDEATSIEVMLDFIGDAIPELPKELVRKLTIKQMRAVFQYIIEELQGDEGNEEKGK